MSTTSDLWHLLGTFPRDVELAKQVESSNPEDSLAIKIAIVGFSYNARTEAWAKGQYDFVKSRLDRDYHDDELSEYGQNSANVKLFFALCIGYLLGLYEQNKISDHEFKVAEVQIPGLIMAELPRITANKLTH